MGGPLGAVFGAMFGHRIEMRLRNYSRRGRRGARRAPASARPAILTDYDILGARPSDSAEELRRKYRALAKKFHPDAVRARGLSESAAAKAADRMARINGAWERICSARGI